MTVISANAAPKPHAHQPQAQAQKGAAQQAPSNSMFQFEVESVFYPELTLQRAHTRRCTNCGYHGPMRGWFKHFAAPWLVLAGLVLSFGGSAAAVMWWAPVADTVGLFADNLFVAVGIVALGLVPLVGFLLTYAYTYKCPHCEMVGANH